MWGWGGFGRGGGYAEGGLREWMATTCVVFFLYFVGDGVAEVGLGMRGGDSFLLWEEGGKRTGCDAVGREPGFEGLPPRRLPCGDTLIVRLAVQQLPDREAVGRCFFRKRWRKVVGERGLCKTETKGESVSRFPRACLIRYLLLGTANALVCKVG